MKDIRSGNDLDRRVAESVRHALRLAGQAENGVERDFVDEREETEVS